MKTDQQHRDLCAARLNTAMAEANMGGAELAKLLTMLGGGEVTRQAIHKLTNGQTTMSLAWARRLSATLGVPPTFLMGLDDVGLGEPPMVARSTVAELDPQQVEEGGLNTPDDGMTILLELDVRAAAGHGGEAPDLETINGQGAHRVLAQWRMPSAFLRANSADPTAVRIIRVAGDSMEPDYAANDRVLVDTSHRHPSPGGIYVLWDGFGLILKRMELIYGSSPPMVRISSSNPAYPTIERLVDDVLINGRVVGKWMWK